MLFDRDKLTIVTNRDVSDKTSTVSADKREKRKACIIHKCHGNTFFYMHLRKRVRRGLGMQASVM